MWRLLGEARHRDVHRSDVEDDHQLRDQQERQQPLRGCCWLLALVVLGCVLMHRCLLLGGDLHGKEGAPKGRSFATRRPRRKSRRLSGYGRSVVGQDGTPERDYSSVRRSWRRSTQPLRGRSAAPVAVVIEGPAGIGKTSLLAEGAGTSGGLRSHACSRRAASELEAAFSFGVVRQLFEAAVATAPDGRAVEAARRRRSAGRRACSCPSDGGRAASEEDVYSRSCTGSTGSTVNLAESRPLAARGRRPAVVRSALAALAGVSGPAARGRCRSASSRRCGRSRTSIRCLTELLVDPATAIVRPNALSAPVGRRARRDRSWAPRPRRSSASPVTARRAATRCSLRELLRTLAAEDVAPVAASVADRRAARARRR